MARFANKVTGAVVNVSEEKGARLGPDWAPADAEPKKRTQRTKKSDEKSED